MKPIKSTLSFSKRKEIAKRHNRRVMIKYVDGCVVENVAYVPFNKKPLDMIRLVRAPYLKPLPKI